MREIWKILAEEEKKEAFKKSMVKLVPGEMRNQKCPCGSGGKSKNCQCETFMGVNK